METNENKNITINIQTLIDKIEITSPKRNLRHEDVEKLVEQALQRAIQNCVSSLDYLPLGPSCTQSDTEVHNLFRKHRQHKNRNNQNLHQTPKTYITVRVSQKDIFRDVPFPSYQDQDEWSLLNEY